MKSGHEIDLDFRPAPPEVVQDRHQPFETGVALERNPQLASGVVLQARDVTLGFGHTAQYFTSEREQPIAGVGQARTLA